MKPRSLPSAMSRFTRNEEGIAAIEFAFIAPIMLFMYFGLAEIATAISVDRKISHSANVAGDLATQSEDFSAAEMTDILQATKLVMSLPEEKLKFVTIEISSYSRTDDDDPASVVNRGTATFKGAEGTNFANFDAANLDTDILNSTSGVVVARVQYLYKPLQLRYAPKEFKITETFMLKPRKSANVDIEDINL